jgi:mycothiol system anti-sigma-R factor
VTCQELHAHLPAYVDGELGVVETLGAGAHLAECPRCHLLAEGERRFRELLRRQPRETAPAELRARILVRCRQEAQRAAIRPWVAPVLATAAAAMLIAVFAVGQPGFHSTPLAGDLVAQHIAYAQIERPAEYATADRADLEAWLRQRAGFQAPVPDYSAAGIRLVGARIAGIRGRKAAYVLYEKGHTLLSVFMLPAPDDAELAGPRVSYRGQEYFAQERKGYRTVWWTDGPAVFGLVSMLDYDALFECADRLREERARQSRL